MDDHSNIKLIEVDYIKYIYIYKCFYKIILSINNNITYKLLR